MTVLISTALACVIQRLAVEQCFSK
jgi:hypothetical protein